MARIALLCTFKHASRARRGGLDGRMQTRYCSAAEDEELLGGGDQAVADAAKGGESRDVDP